MTDAEIARLESILQEIRDLEREHLDEYRRITSRSLELQEQAVARQQQVTRIYKGALVGVTVILAGVIALLIYLLSLLGLF